MATTSNEVTAKKSRSNETAKYIDETMKYIANAVAKAISYVFVGFWVDLAKSIYSLFATKAEKEAVVEPQLEYAPNEAVVVEEEKKLSSEDLKVKQTMDFLAGLSPQTGSIMSRLALKYMQKAVYNPNNMQVVVYKAPKLEKNDVVQDKTIVKNSNWSFFTPVAATLAALAFISVMVSR